MTAIIERKDDGLMAFSPGWTSRANLIEALALFFETASPSDVARRFQNEVLVTPIEMLVGQAEGLVRRRNLPDPRAAWIRTGPPMRCHRIMQKGLRQPRLHSHSPSRLCQAGALFSIIRQPELAKSLFETE